MDLTRAYYNLLGIEKTDGMQTFFWDFNVAVMEDERKKLHYYLQDDLGSPLRVLYGIGSGEVYGYDEFGRDFYEMEEEDSSKRRYSRQGEKQPFGYTGYRYDPVSGTYFAQAREYRPEFGRFMAEDIKSGRGTEPKTLNRYGYCWNNPVGLVDLDGKEPELPSLEDPLPTIKSQKNDILIVPYEMEEKETDGNNLISPFPVDQLPKIEGAKSGGGLIRNDGVKIINVSFGIGAILYGSIGLQLVVSDTDCALQACIGGGIKVGAGGNVAVSNGYLNVPSAEKSEGWGFETGVNGGIVITGGANLISAYDNGFLVGTGEMVSVGFGAEGTVVEAHMGGSYAKNLIYVKKGVIYAKSLLDGKEMATIKEIIDLYYKNLNMENKD